MKVTFLKRNNKEFRDFKRKEWESIHPEHFGKTQDKTYWNAIKVRIKASEKGKIVGALTGTIMAGVFHLEELIVDRNERGKGIGKDLLERIEFYAKTERVHVIHLETGEDWKALPFYEKMGFKKEALIKNLYEHKNFWLLVKYI